MPRIQLTDHDLPRVEELVALYDSVGWNTYTRDPSLLYDAMSRSLRVVCARDGDRLVGLARVVGDGLTIVYLQDILVAPTHQRRQIGTRLLQSVLEPFCTVRQKALITDDEPRQRAFYEARGFTEIRDMDSPIRAFVKFD
ncbi:GNAT family N-acetyltransferase [Propioniciclava coleopterorum]|uniref:GNAT family N-acetyltransferase n=1 Tax=Propioniciclava coleopterorum TaxID=2714937 RepID=A0A6G7Y771_9ACTN|nr:GNAT family N-acetyltransferase [Propioniciclava coleopterorum]QIK72559.1 GNAT family N-acetyltransferase [Propioniciclava coleopterorum]